MPRPKKPQYEFIPSRNLYRKRIKDCDGQYVAIYGKTPEELTAKLQIAKQEIEEAVFRKSCPTVADYTEKWLTMHSNHVRTTTMNDYRTVAKNYIVEPIGDMYMTEVTPDDLNGKCLAKASTKSKSIYDKTNMLLKMIFGAAEKSNIINNSPAENLNPKGGRPPKERTALTEEQIEILLNAIRDFPPYPFVMIGLYAGLRREEILALKWDCVELDGPAPYISVRRAWHIEHNRPVITNELKTAASKRNIPIPPQLVECLKELKLKSTSEYVIANQTDGGPLSGTQWQRLWNYITVRSTKVRTYTRYINGEKVKHTVTPVLGEKAAHNNTCVYSMDFQVTPHQLRHTYITHLVLSGMNIKKIQYLAGHENIKMTMDVYTHLLNNRPEDLIGEISNVFAQNN